MAIQDLIFVVEVLLVAVVEVAEDMEEREAVMVEVAEDMEEMVVLGAEVVAE